MAMTQRTKNSSSRKKMSLKSFFASTAGKKTMIMGVAVLALVSLVVVINGFPNKNLGTQYGVGADGFSVFEAKGANLGAAVLVDKQTIQDELGSLTSSIRDVNTSGVVSLNGKRGQTATYLLTTKSGTSGSFYVDIWQYPNAASQNSEDIITGTGDAGKINGLTARYMPAVTIANEREYALIVSKGLRLYKFAITQPYKDVKIDEVTAQAALKRIAAKASL